MGNFIATNFKLLRDKKGLNQAQISISLGFNRSTWNNYETGKSQPNLDDLIKISKYFGVTITELVEIDLTNVQLIRKNEDDEKQQNVQLNVKGNVQLNPKKGVLYKVNDAPAAVANEGESGYLTSQNLIAALQETVEAQKALNAHLVQQVATLNEQITKLKTKKSTKAP